MLHLFVEEVHPLCAIKNDPFVNTAGTVNYIIDLCTWLDQAFCLFCTCQQIQADGPCAPHLPTFGFLNFLTKQLRNILTNVLQVLQDFGVNFAC